MLALFSVPLVAHADINIDLKPLTQYVASRLSPAPDMNTEHLVVAARTLNASARINTLPVANTPAEEATQKTDLQHYQDLLSSNETLHAQAQRSQ